VVTFDNGSGRDSVALRVVEQKDHIVVQCALIALQRQRVV